MGLSFVSANSHADTAKVPKTCLVMHTDFGSTGSESILLASARGLFRMYSPPKLAGKYFIEFLAEPLVIANTDSSNSNHGFRSKSTKN